MRALLILTAGLSVTTPAIAQTDTWTFNGPQVPLGNTTTFLSTPSGLLLNAAGFGPGGPVGLFQKNLGGPEVGLGLQNDPAGINEITTGSFVQLSLLPGVNIMDVSLGTNSTSGGEQWGLALSNTSGVLGSVFQTGTTNTTVTFQSGGASFLDVTEVSGIAGNGVLVAEMDEPSPGLIPPGTPVPPGIPEPSSLSLYATALALLAVVLGHVLRRRDDA